MSRAFEGVPLPMTVMFFVVAAIILTAFIFLMITFIRGNRKYRQCKALPPQSERARVVSKRTDVSGHNHTSTAYYITFELDSGERIELYVSGRDFGMIAEGDDGILTHQDVLFNSFTRS